MSDLGRIDGKTKLIGFLADPSSHSKSPAIHNAGFRKLNLNYAFLAFTVGNEELEEAIRGVRALNLQGFSVSMPNKIKVMEFIDEISPEAEMIGAVNTVLNDNGKLIGFNTDGYGYIRSIEEEGIQIKGKKITILGAGGAGTAIAIQAALEDAAEITIFNRNDEFYEKAVRNAEIINSSTDCKATVYQLEDEGQLKKEIESSSVLANATYVGMKDLEGQTIIKNSTWLRQELVVTDAIYYPVKTLLLEQATARGCQSINGLGMLLWQGARQFKIWTGEELPVEYVKENVEI